MPCLYGFLFLSGGISAKGCIVEMTMIEKCGADHCWKFGIGMAATSGPAERLRVREEDFSLAKMVQLLGHGGL